MNRGDYGDERYRGEPQRNRGYRPQEMMESRGCGGVKDIHNNLRVTSAGQTGQTGQGAQAGKKDMMTTKAGSRGGNSELPVPMNQSGVWSSFRHRVMTSTTATSGETPSRRLLPWGSYESQERRS